MMYLQPKFSSPPLPSSVQLVPDLHQPRLPGSPSPSASSSLASPFSPDPPSSSPSPSSRSPPSSCEAVSDRSLRSYAGPSIH
eukprot:767275-Hanusia_phi.AAC.2